MKSHIKAHKYEVKRNGVIGTRVYLTGKAVFGYDPDSKKFLFLKSDPVFLKEGEQAKLGVLDNGVYLREMSLEEDLLEDVLEGLISTSSIGFAKACRDLIALAEERT